MNINQIRAALYKSARILGDIQAATHKKPAKAVPKRIARRLAGKGAGRLLGKIFPPTR